MKINPVFLRLKKEEEIKQNHSVFFSVAMFAIMLYFTVGVVLATYKLDLEQILRMFQQQ